MPKADTLFKKSEKPNEFFLITDLFARKLAFPIAWLLYRLGVGANAVTIVSGYLWVASVPMLLWAGICFSKEQLSAGWGFALSSAALWSVGYVLDVVDGSLARMNSTQGPAGAYLDYYFHLLFQPMFLCSIGVFLYLVSANFGYLVLGLLAIGGNWPVSHSAREHTLCEQVAEGKCKPERLSDAARYETFIDTPKIKTAGPVGAKGTGLIGRIAKEALFFPGQFSFLGLVLLGDFLLRGRFGEALYGTKLSFTVGSLLLVGSIPFRMRREFLRMKVYERESSKTPDSL